MVLYIFISLYIIVISKSVFSAQSVSSHEFCIVVKKMRELDKKMTELAAGTDCQAVKTPTECLDILVEFPHSKDEVYTIHPEDRKGPMQVFCDMKTDGGGWIVIQRRTDGTQDFYRPWIKYATGFGNLTREFWLGNLLISRLTKLKSYELRIDFDSHTSYAHYASFNVTGMAGMFMLNVTGYSGTAGDGLSENSGSRFSAKDIDVDSDKSVNCAAKLHGGWWYSACGQSNLNGVMLTSSPHPAITWTSRPSHRNLKSVEMKIRPNLR